MMLRGRQLPMTLGTLSVGRHGCVESRFGRDVMKMARFANRRAFKIAMNGIAIHASVTHRSKNGVVIRSGGLKPFTASTITRLTLMQA